MRQDASIDKKQVRCPNASHLGFDKQVAQVGDIVQWNIDGDNARIGRMIGRIAYAPMLAGDVRPIQNYILVLALAPDMSYTCERWVNPADVTRVQAIREQRAVMEYFLSDQVVKAPIAEVRAAASEMWTTLTRYRTWFHKARQTGKAETESTIS
jgi:hypothetical protein